ncbi:isoprenoid synthase domain-containing protein [Boletus edulis]|uniref:Terpene synthase n=1 Tax=Boletus edulis BED1 TaxID=1328754 RepID=A0AAD4BS39_BOLED|nr:isoprenoid synthase domain-containing protein [Boletus edulis]KAF8438386.1 isoprenoid synthase domain-containing protein [Boletus edulis BED1]
MIFDTPFPPQFCLQDLCAITGRVFELRVNPHQAEADRAARAWFNSINLYDDRKRSKFINYGKFDLFAALTYPDADSEHLITGLMFFFWAFAADDMADESDFRYKPDDVHSWHHISRSVFANPEGCRPEEPYAAMLYDILSRFRTTSTPGAYKRFYRAFESWSHAHVTQSRNRSQDRIASVDEFILMRRSTIGAALVEATIEYSLDLDIPDEVFENPIIQEMSKATNDLMTWPNDLCSFNKEQSDGDYQNLVFCIMHERKVGLQAAIDILTEMLSQRVEDYIQLKSRLPSFGPEADQALSRYLSALENFVQGTVLWYYLSPRYFRGVDITNREDLVIPLFEPGAF